MTKPLILNINKPKDISSYDVIRKWKPRLKKLGKVGHFGTLDPFADGVLMLGVAGAQRLNEYIHECLPKTYLATGILGVETPTGDMTVDPTQLDESDFLKSVIGKFDIPFIQQKVQDKFLGEYWQAPHKYSAAKFEGKALHQWAREGIEIKKEKKKREIYSLEIVEYNFPKLSFRVEVSSGTYIRSLFSDIANELGTIGTLENLTREKVGGCTLDNSLSCDLTEVDPIPFIEIDTVLPFGEIIFADKEAKLYSNGVKLKQDRISESRDGKIKDYYWAKDLADNILGLATIENEHIVSKVNFS
jgi:tRNA pseudouridine55 synthase